MRYLPLIAIAATTQLAHAAPERAVRLRDIFEDASTVDGRIREALALNLAAHEAVPQALAALLPQLTFQASHSVGALSGEVDEPLKLNNGLIVLRNANHQTSYSGGWDLTLSVPIFSGIGLARLSEARSVERGANEDYLAAKNALAARVVTTYFSALEAQEILTVALNSRRSFAIAFRDALQRTEAGLATDADVKEARAALDQNLADIIASKQVFARSQSALAEISFYSHEQLAPLRSDVTFHPLTPSGVDNWIGLALQDNPSILSKRAAVALAKGEILESTASRLPTVTMTLASSRSTAHAFASFSSSAFALDQATDIQYHSALTGLTVKLTVSMNLFTGGYSQSKSRQAEYTWRAAQQDLVESTRRMEGDVRDGYLAVLDAEARASATKAAAESSAYAADAVSAAYDVGLANQAEVLKAIRASANAAERYSSSRYAYVNALVHLKVVSGSIDPHTISELDALLGD